MSIKKFNSEGYYDPTTYEAMTAVEKEEMALRAFRPIVYICSPYAGVVSENIENARKYPHKFEVTDTASFAEAVSRDYVCAEYMNHYRNGENFLGSDCLPVDCDNDHSENPADWVTPADVQAAFPGITFAVHYSRFHMREKNSKSARPKFHVLFPIEYMTDATAYSEMKKLVNTIFTYFDTKALDAARFFFGTANPEVELHPGEMTLSEYLSAEDFDADMPSGSHGGTQVIPEGSRNATMSRFAGRVIKKYGDSEEAFECFLEEAN